jgi:ectoine hydroxylase-related dioxygenase (phytanoyl-CoA dioxygenase family)
MMQTQRALSESQIEEFRRDGFLIIRALFTAAEARQHEAWITELSSRPPEIGRQMVYFEDSTMERGVRVLSRIEKFVEYHDGLRGVVHDARVVNAVADVLGDRPALFKEKINFKLPGGGGFAPHQDIQPGWDRYAPYFVSVLIAVDENTVENGCLELAAGAHTRGLIGRQWEPLEGDELAGLDFRSYPMAPGDVALFDCFTPHQSEPNRTSQPRRNVYVTYNRLRDGDFREQYFADKRRSFPPDYERDPRATYVFRV